MLVVTTMRKLASAKSVQHERFWTTTGDVVRTECQECVSRARCLGGAVIVAEETFWHTGKNDTADEGTCELDYITRYVGR